MSHGGIDITRDHLHEREVLKRREVIDRHFKPEFRAVTPMWDDLVGEVDERVQYERDINQAQAELDNEFPGLPDSILRPMRIDVTEEKRPIGEVRVAIGLAVATAIVVVVTLLV